jgi:hypothetical protein
MSDDLPTASTPQKSRPAHTERIGTVSASIWANTTTAGRTFYSVTFERTYRGEGDELKQASRFNHDDLLNVAKIAERTEAWIAAKTAEGKSRAAA